MDIRVREKYLQQYAEPEAGAAAVTRLGIVHPTPWQHALIIPAYRESFEDISRVWHQLAQLEDCLAIVVINSPEPDEPWARQLVAQLKVQADAITMDEQFTFIAHANKDEKTSDMQAQSPDLLIVNRYSKNLTIPVKAGVGLARKIGTDIALQLVHTQHVLSPWLGNTDADAELPSDYFVISPLPGDAALVYPFRHTAVAHLRAAADAYELSMLYYAAGLNHAGSRYAFPTIGSTIICHADYYAAVRGFPVRNTGEDFYLLNKLQKVGNVRPIEHTPVLLQGRLSDRVPIGTGQGIGRLLAADAPADMMQVEHPDCFEALRAFLILLGQAASNLESPARWKNETLRAYADKINLTRHIESRIQASMSPAVLTKQIDDWFDGLKTRQFVHHFRDHEYGSITLHDLSLAPFVNPQDVKSAQDQLRAQILRAKPH